jgi:hypothetical protein
MRPEAEIDWLVGHLLDRENAIGERFHAGAVGVARLCEKTNNLSVPHERELVAMLGQQRRKKPNENIIIVVDLATLSRCIHDVLQRFIYEIARLIADAKGFASGGIACPTK